MKKSLRWAVLARHLVACAISSRSAVAQGAGQAGRRSECAALLGRHLHLQEPRPLQGMMEEMKADVERAELRQERKRSHRQTRRSLRSSTREPRTTSKWRKNSPSGRPICQVRGPNAEEPVPATRSQDLPHRLPGNLAGHRLLSASRTASTWCCKFNGEPVDVNRPESVLTFINRPVVWYQPSLDITDRFLQDLNRTAIDPRHGRSAPPRRPAGVPFSGNRR